MTCQHPIGPVSLCSLRVLPGTDRCQNHTNCLLCAKPLGEEIAHAAAGVNGGPVEFSCHSCFVALMAKFPPKRKLPPCDGCGAEFGAGCSCPENSRAIGRGERRDP